MIFFFSPIYKQKQSPGGTSRERRVWGCSPQGCRAAAWLPSVRGLGNGCTYCRQAAPPASAGPSSSSHQGLGGRKGGQTQPRSPAHQQALPCKPRPSEIRSNRPEIWREEGSRAPFASALLPLGRKQTLSEGVPPPEHPPPPLPPLLAAGASLRKEQCGSFPPAMGAATSRMSFYLKVQHYLPAWKTAEGCCPLPVPSPPPSPLPVFLFPQQQCHHPTAAAGRGWELLTGGGIAPAPLPRRRPVPPRRCCPPRPARGL